MRRKDAWLLGVVWAALAVLMAPALLRPGLFLGNFGDIYGYHYPLQHLALSRLQGGQLPFWNPYIFCGQPHLADPQTALFYPLSVVAHALPLGYSFTLHAALHLGLAALGMHLLLRSEGLDAPMAGALAGAFALSPMLVYRIPQGIPTQLAALSWVPWCWLALKSGRPGILALVWSLQFLAGHPEYLAVNAAAMALSRLARPREWTILLREGALAALLCALQLVPTMEFLLESNRPGLPAALAAAYPLPLGSLATLLRPGAGGTPLEAGYAGLPSVFFETRALYVGLAPLALALYGLWSALARRPAAVAALRGSILSAWGIAAAGVLLASGRFPLIALSRVPARFGLLVVWGLLTAAAGGWTALRGRMRVRPVLKAAVLAGILLDVGSWSSRFVYAQTPGPYLGAKAPLREFLAGGRERFASDPALANPDKAMLYRAQNVNGYAAYFLRRYAPYAARAERGPAADLSRTYIRSAGSPEMSRLGVAYSLVPSPQGVELRRSPGAWPLAYLALPSGGFAPVSWDSPRPEFWTMDGSAAGTGGRLVLAVPAYPGWRAWVGGREAAVGLHDGLVQAVEVGRGVFSARFRYRPRGWAALCAVSSLSLLAALILLRRGGPR